MDQSSVNEWMRSLVDLERVSIRQVIVALFTVLLEREKDQENGSPRLLERYLEGLKNYLFSDSAISRSYFPYEIEDDFGGKTIAAYSPDIETPSIVFGNKNEKMLNVSVIRDEEGAHVSAGEAERAGVHQDGPFRYKGSLFTAYNKSEGELHIMRHEDDATELIDEILKEDDIERQLGLDS